MAENIGYATLNVVPTSKGFGKTLKGQVAGPMSAAGVAGGKGLMGGLGKSVLKLGGMVGAAVAGFAGIKTVIGGGISRQLQLEQATAKLDGLGHSSKNVTKIMDNALASVKGTAFGLGDAATVAASSVAAGVKPGQDLQRTLSLVGDAATIAGTDMGEMGAIFNKVAAANKVQMDVINQLHDQGVPALSLLAKELGVTAEEASKMASSGKIDFATFQAAMEAGMGGAALKSGNTTAGAFANMKAALGRLGETFTGPAFAGARNFFNLITAGVDALNTIVKPVFDSMSKSVEGGIATSFANAAAAVERFTPVLQGVVQILSGGDFDQDLLGDAISPQVYMRLLGVREAIVAVSDAIKTGDWSAVGTMLTRGLEALMAMRQQLVDGILNALPGILQAFAEMLPGIVQGVAAMVSGMVGVLAEIAVTLVQVITGALPMILQALVAAAPVILEGAMVAFQSLVQALVMMIPQITTALVTMIPQIASMLVTLTPQLIQGALQLFQGLVQAVGQIVPPLLQAVVTLLPVIAQALIGMLPTLIQAGIQLFMALVQALPQIIPPLISAVVGLLPKLITTLTSLIPQLIQGAIQLFMALVKAIPKVIPPLIQAVIGAIPQIVGALIRMIPALLSGAVQLFMAIVKAIPQIIPALLGAIGSLAVELVNAVVAIGGQLFEAGKNIVQGLLDGIASLAGTVGQFFLNLLPGWIVGPFKAALGIHSPSRVFAGFGKNIGQGLINGLTGTKDKIKSTTSKLAQQVRDAFTKVADKRAAAAKRLSKLDDQMASAQARLAKTRKGDDKDAIASAKRRVRSIAKEQAEQRKLIRDADRFLKSSTKSSVINSIRATTKRLNAIATQRDKVADRLKAAQDKLKEALDTRNSFATSVREGIFGQFDLSESYGTDHAITSLKAQLATAKTAKATFEKLRKLGLNDDGYQQLVEAFASSGDIGPAKAILAGGKTAIKEVNSLQKQLKSVATSVGSQTSKALYQSGVDAANGLVKGLQSQKKKLTGLMADIATSLATAVKKKLKIHSPSRVFRDLGAFTGEGMARGLESSASRIERASRALQPTAPSVPDGGLIGAQSRTADALSKAVTPLVGNLTLQSTGDTRDDLDEALFHLRRIRRGGTHAA